MLLKQCKVRETDRLLRWLNEFGSLDRDRRADQGTIDPVPLISPGFRSGSRGGQHSGL